MDVTSAVTQKPKRFSGIDIVKIVAAFFVIGIHTFLYDGYYNYSIPNNKVELGAICMRWIAYTCVPLFMITTGFLMKNKKISKKYYAGLLPILFVYLVVSIICVLFNKSHYGTVYTAWTFFKGLLMFTDAQYAWYVEYYICLFLLLPFINLGWNELKCAKHRIVFVASVTLISICSESFFIGAEDPIRLFPGYFPRLYPIAYYLIGCCIREYPPKKCILSKVIALFVTLAALAWLTFTTFHDSINNVDNNYIFLSKHFNDYGAFPVGMAAVGIFLLLFDITIRNRIVAKILTILGKSTLGCYLISYIFDSMTYMDFCAKYTDVGARLDHIFPVMLKIFGLSMLCGVGLHLLYEGISLGVKSINLQADEAERREQEIKQQIAEVKAAQAEAEAAAAEQKPSKKQK